jgi:hypothetical protein
MNHYLTRVTSTLAVVLGKRALNLGNSAELTADVLYDC